MVVASKVISRNVTRSQVISQKIILTDRISLLPQVQARMNFASAVPPLEADFFDEKGLLKQYIPQNQQQYQHTGSMYVLKKFQGNPNDGILFSDNGIEIQHNISHFSFRSRSCSNPYSRFPIPRISAYGSSKPISNRLFPAFQISWIRENASNSTREGSYEYRFTHLKSVLKLQLQTKK